MSSHPQSKSASESPRTTRLAPHDETDLQKRLQGGGEMGELVRAHDWDRTELGAIETWPQSLLTAVDVCLNSRFPMVVFWGPSLITIYNDAYRPSFGTKHPHVLGAPAETLWPEAWHLLGPMMQQVIDSGIPTWSEDQFLLVNRKGFSEETYWTFSYSPIRSHRGSVDGVFTAVSETTSRVLGERRLRTLRELGFELARTRTVQDTARATAAILSKNPKDLPFALIYLGDSKRLLLSGTSGETAAHIPAPQEVTPASAQEAWDGVLFRVLEQGEAALIENRSALALPIAQPAQEDAAGVLVVGLSPHLGFDDNYRGFLSLVAGQLAAALSSAKAYEEERRRAEALAELDRAKTAFFSNVSHELRTPLTLMLGPVEDALTDTQDPLPEQQRERLELVRRSGLRLQKLVNTLLDFARIEAGRAQASFVPVDLSTLTRDLASSFDSVMANAGLTFVVDCPPLPHPVYVDPSMWEKVVLNLLSNAFKFTFKGEVQVALTWLGECVELTVRDTGVGIPQEELPRIFERFHRVEGAPGRSHEGTGIGLALVQELAKLHGGSVDVKSALGHGSTFTVRLPTGSAHLPKNRAGAHTQTFTSTGIGADAFLAEVSQWNVSEAPGPAAAPLTSPGLADGAPSTLRAEARILVVDDNTDMRSYLSRLLSPHWSVLAVSNGAQALAAAQAHPPDLILADVMMPGMDGLSLLRALRADERTRTIPVVLLSARAGEEATIEGLKSGPDEYLVKPFSANELLARIKAQLTVSHLRQEALRAERAHAQRAGKLLEEARRAARSREETLAIVSHDLRAPLCAINTAAELLQRGLGEDGGNARLLKHASSIRRFVGRMSRLIDDLLDSASIDAGTLSLYQRPHTAEELVRELQEMFEPQSVEKGLRFTTEVQPGLLSIECDKERILQALGNLVSNSFKFTPAGGSVSVRAKSGPEGILFSVTDTGSGISPSALAHVFDRFWHSSEEGRRGHGLGLAITKGIVEAHGGSIRAESAPGQGSTFTVVLPLRTA